jgi:type IV secretory pathway component VirB8
VQFQWHPELAMSHDDRTLNPAGMQVLAYASQSEVAR